MVFSTVTSVVGSAFVPSASEYHCTVQLEAGVAVSVVCSVPQFVKSLNTGAAGLAFTTNANGERVEAQPVVRS